MYWTIAAPAASDVSAHVANRPPKRKRGSAGDALPRSTPLPHLLQMHFIQVKVGKLSHDVPAAKLTLFLNFASKGPLYTAFEASVCGQMQNIGVDGAFHAAAIAAGAISAAAVAPLKTYVLEPTFELATSRNVSAPVNAQLHRHRIALTSTTDASFWGPRVRAFCAATNFTLFQ